MPRIVTRRETSLSPWVRLVENTVDLSPGSPPELYHSVAQADYVTIVARTRSGLVPIVSQFRPAVDRVTWELPGGMLDPDEDRAACCRRELREEAGLDATHVQLLGSFWPDTGRLENRIHVFAVDATDPDPAFVPEPGMTVSFVAPAELRARILDGSFDAQLHIGALATAELHGFRLGIFEP